MKLAACLPVSVTIWKEMCRNSQRDTLPLICSKTPILSILALICKVTLDVSDSFVHSVGSIWLLRKVLEAGDALRLISI